jgi:probable DNA-directed RNA polymerase|nr:MAG TPA: DNA directed RNA polymerase [Caudoviricetes sp.]
MDKIELIKSSMYQSLERYVLDYTSSKSKWTTRDEQVEIIKAMPEYLVERVFRAIATLPLEGGVLQTITGMIFTSKDKTIVWDIQLGALVLAVCQHCGLYDINRIPNDKGSMSYLVKPNADLIAEGLLETNLPLDYDLRPSIIPLEYSDPSEHILGHKANTLMARENISSTINLDILEHLSSVGYGLDLDFINSTLDDTNRSEGVSKFNSKLRDMAKEYSTRPFYFEWNYDKRGRIYSKGYLINVQANEYGKALLRFYHPREVNSRGNEWLLIDIANAYGLDKANWETRLQWSKDNLETILNSSSLEATASDKLLFRQAVKEYKYYLQTGKSRQIVRLDATASGYQLMSVITRDKKAMEMLNVLGNTRRQDFYSLVYDRVRELVQPRDRDDLDLWLEAKAKELDLAKPRDVIKASIMTSAYNSVATPKIMLGNYYGVFEQAIDELASGASSLKEYINSLYEPRMYHQWRLPDGHWAYVPSLVTKTHKIEVKELDKSIKYPSFNIRCEDNEASKDNWRSLAVNIVHSLDAWVCRQVVTMLRERGIVVSPIHDSFGVYANDCDELRKCYRYTLARLYKEPILECILQQVSDKPIDVKEFMKGEYNEDIYNAIRHNEQGYYIC